MAAKVLDTVRFRNDGETYTLTREDVIRAVATVEPEPVRTHAVTIEGRRFPIKQAFSVATGMDKLDFITETARRNLMKLGFKAERVS